MRLTSNFGSHASPTQALAWLEQMLEECGLQQRGHFLLQAQDELLPQHPEKSGLLVLVGNVGSGFWANFANSPEALDGLAHPLDRWSQRIGQILAAYCDGQVYFPFGGPPYHPFQRWATKAEGLGGSPLGLKMHPTYGLWHAYRFALVIPTLPLAVDEGDLPRPHPNGVDTSGVQQLSDVCAQCSTQACLSTCPVDAFTPKGYDVNACATYLNTSLSVGASTACMGHACQARMACPVGADYRYSIAHGQFHMQHFAMAHR